MGRVARKKPVRLAEKLLTIRHSQGLSQGKLVKALGLSGEIREKAISDFELGKSEPPAPVLLAYGDLAGVYVDVLIDDELDLPEKLPASPKSAGIKRKGRRKPVKASI